MPLYSCAGRAAGSACQRVRYVSSPSSAKASSRSQYSSGSPSSTRLRAQKLSTTSPSAEMCQCALGGLLRRSFFRRFEMTSPPQVMSKSGLQSVSGLLPSRASGRLQSAKGALAMSSATMENCFSSASLASMREGADCWPSRISLRGSAEASSSSASSSSAFMRAASVRLMTRTTGSVSSTMPKNGSVRGMFRCTGPPPRWLSSSNASLMIRLACQASSSGTCAEKRTSEPKTPSWGRVWPSFWPIHEAGRSAEMTSRGVLR